MNKMFQVKYITYDSRNSNILCQPKINKINYGKKTFSYYGTHIWNSLPNIIKQCTSFDNFQTMLKAWECPKCKWWENVMLKMKIIWYICRKVNYSLCTLKKSESPQTGASYSYLDKMYAVILDNEPFICCYCNFTTMKLEANNVNIY